MREDETVFVASGLCGRRLGMDVSSDTIADNYPLLMADAMKDN